MDRRIKHWCTADIIFNVQAYDTVSRPELWARMRKMKLGKFCVLFHFYFFAHTSVTSNRFSPPEIAPVLSLVNVLAFILSLLLIFIFIFLLHLIHLPFLALLPSGPYSWHLQLVPLKICSWPFFPAPTPYPYFCS